MLPQAAFEALTGDFLEATLGARLQAVFNAGLLRSAVQLDPALAAEASALLTYLTLGWMLVQLARQRGTLKKGARGRARGQQGWPPLPACPPPPHIGPPSPACLTPSHFRTHPAHPTSSPNLPHRPTPQHSPSPQARS